jgi:16S rRNA (cytidine1402-2'-O)-methyltransferase
MAQTPGVLHVVATPIGNLEDLSPRALATLREAAAIYCEDTRVTGKLAARFGLSTPRFSCHEHNEMRRIPEILERLARGESVALVSDAGTPGLSDPGRHVVAAAAQAGFPVVGIPGPSASVLALSVSGLSGSPHHFEGYLPPRGGDRRKRLEELAARTETLVFFEAPHRIGRFLESAAAALGDRPAVVCRELTKLHEEILRGTLPELAASLASSPGRGEYVVVVAGAPLSTESWSDADIDAAIARRAGQPPRELARELALESGRPAREIYKMIVERKT